MFPTIKNYNNGFRVRCDIRRRHRGPPFALGYHQIDIYAVYSRIVFADVWISQRSVLCYRSFYFNVSAVYVSRCLNRCMCMGLCCVHSYIVYILHSHVQSADQKRVFKNPGAGVRKIVSQSCMISTIIRELGNPPLGNPPP